MVKYINIWIGCDNDGILSWLSRHLTYDPLIWSKLTSLTSTVSVLKDGKKIHLKFYYSFQEMNFKKISSLNNLTGLNDLDSIISSFHQINYWAWRYHQPWYQNYLSWSHNVGWIFKHPLLYQFLATFQFEEDSDDTFDQGS